MEKNQMKLAACRRRAWGMIAVAVLAGCGAGVEESGVADGGTGGTGIAYGSVTGFGSVFVNGVRFDTTSAAVLLDGLPGPDPTSDPRRGLAEGMVIRVEGTIDPGGSTGNASRITYGRNLAGPIGDLADVDMSTRRATVLGQTVILDGQTVFRGTGLGGLTTGNVIEVSGLVDEQDRIHATYVEWRADAFQPGMAIGVTGTVEGLNEGRRTFRIGSLTVDYASADTGDLPGGVPANGSYVAANGSSFGPGGALTATRVGPEVEGIGVPDAEAAEIEGFVTAVNGPNDFVIGNQRFVTTAATFFKGGLVTDVAVGTRLEVEGALMAGLLTAHKVEFRDGIALESAVAAVYDDGSLMLKGLPEIAVYRNPLTRIDGFDPGRGIAPDDRVKIRARVTGGRVVASKIEEKDVDPEKTKVELQGPVGAIAGSALVILGVEIDTAGTVLRDAAGQPLAPEQFFAALSLYDLVEAEGLLQGDGTVRWSEVELED